MPAPVVTRLNAVTYGGFAVGTNSNYHLHGVTVTEQDYASLTVDFQVFVNHDTAATFVTQCTALEAAYRKPNGNLLVTLNSNNWINLSQSGNTGMNAIPSIRKAGGGADSNNSRIYDCSVTVMLPADETGKAGRQSSTVTLTEDGSEAIHLDIAAAYTAITTNSALVQAQAQFPTYVGTLQSAAGGTWDELSARTYSHDSDNKVCRCNASYKQILSAQAQGSTNHATLQGVWSEVTTDRVGIGANPGGTYPLVKIAVKYFCYVRSSVSTDLRSVYENTIRPHMIAIARSYSNTQQVSAILDRPGLRPQDNSISARMVFLAPGGSSLIRADTNVASIHREAHFFVPVLDGKPYSRDKHSRPGFKGAAVATTVLILGTKEDGGGAQPFLDHDKEVNRLVGLGYQVMETSEPTHKHIEFTGISGTAKLSLLSLARSTQLEYAELRPVGGGTRVRGARGTYHSSIVRD